jgi:hypothetical protein
MQQAISAYRSITATPEFLEAERLRSKARHDEAQALFQAHQKGARESDEKWQVVVAEKDAALADKDAALVNKDAENAQLREQLAALQSRLNEGK